MRHANELQHDIDTLFQSTHPLRDATIYLLEQDYFLNISIHAPLTGCDFFSVAPDGALSRISIHAPLTGCDYEDDENNG